MVCLGRIGNGFGLLSKIPRFVGVGNTDMEYGMELDLTSQMPTGVGIRMAIWNHGL